MTTVLPSVEMFVEAALFLRDRGGKVFIRAQ